jgi:hypothetical protein
MAGTRSSGMASQKEATEPPIGSSTQPSAEEKIPAAMSFGEFAELLERRPDLRGEVTEVVTYKGKAFWTKGDGALSREEIQRRVAAIDQAHKRRKEIQDMTGRATSLDATKRGNSPEEWVDRGLEGTLEE